MRYCRICYTTENLVHDHNHKTGFIRGTLCQPCNSMLSIYEGCLKYGYKTLQIGFVYCMTRKGQPMKVTGKHVKWFEKYKDQVLEHLATSTGMKYTGDNRRALARLEQHYDTSHT